MLSRSSRTVLLSPTSTPGVLPSYAHSQKLRWECCLPWYLCRTGEGMCTTPSISSAFFSSGIASYRRSNSARVRRSPFSSGGVAPLLGASVGSTGIARGVDTAMGSASGTPDSLEEIALTIIRDLGPARQRAPCHERDTRKRFKAWVSCSDPAPVWVARSRSFAKERPRVHRSEGDGNRDAAGFSAWAAGPPDELCGPI